MNEAYDETYGIAYHNEDSSPSSLFTKKSAEDAITNNGLYERMEDFTLRKVGNYFNISFDAFLQQPSYVCDMMIEVARQRCKEDAEAAENAANQFKNMQGK